MAEREALTPAIRSAPASIRHVMFRCSKQEREGYCDIWAHRSRQEPAGFGAR